MTSMGGTDAAEGAEGEWHDTCDVALLRSWLVVEHSLLALCKIARAISICCSTVK